MHTKLGDHSNCTCVSNSNILYSHQTQIYYIVMQALYVQVLSVNILLYKLVLMLTATIFI